jgi:aminoglycoside phosphotransferase (APT) family kinase protein
VAATGLPVPKLYELVELDGRHGIVYDRINGEELLKGMLSRPWTLLAGARLLAEEHARIHKHKAEGLPRLKESLHRRISSITLGEQAKERLIGRLTELPDGETLCHGDLHPGNIMVSARGPVIIDWDNAQSGNPLGDVARTCLLLLTGEVRASRPVKWLIGKVKRKAYEVYLRRYCHITGVCRQEIEQWMPLIVATRLTEGIAEERDSLLSMLGGYGII